MNITVVIPSLDPDERLERVVHGLLDAGFSDFLLVDDGSAPEHTEVFRRLAELSQVTVLHHPVNQGKGRALKTAFAYLTEHRPDCEGVVTVDGDGQHLPQDVMRVAQAMTAGKREMILGARNFDLPAVPSRSRFGNKASRITMRLLCGLRITDTQTGLRGIPAVLFPALLAVRGERFEYETNALLELNQKGTAIREVPIETVYEGNNEVSHFRPVRDGLRVYCLILSYFLRFAGSSLLCFSVDLLLFYLLGRFVFHGLKEHNQILCSTVAARIVSSLLNFTLNRRAVFHASGRLTSLLCRFYALSITQMLCSAGLMMLLCWLLPVPQTLMKCVVDTTLFLVSYQIQRRYVFGQKPE